MLTMQDRNDAVDQAIERCETISDDSCSIGADQITAYSSTERDLSNAAPYTVNIFRSGNVEIDGENRGLIDGDLLDRAIALMDEVRR